MKFKIIVGILVIGIIALFTSVFYLSNNLNNTNEMLEAQADTLRMQQEALRKRNKEIEDYKNQLLGAVQSEEVYWEIAREQKSVESYIDYLIKFESDTTNHYVPQAKEALDNLLAKEGFIQLIESNGNKLFETYNSYSDSEKFVVAKIAMNVRRGVIGNDDYTPASRNGDIISEGQVVKILIPDIKSGNSTWAKVAYN